MLIWIRDNRGDTKLSASGYLTEMVVDQVLSNPENWPRDLGRSFYTDEFGHHSCVSVGEFTFVSMVKFQAC